VNSATLYVGLGRNVPYAGRLGASDGKRRSDQERSGREMRKRGHSAKVTKNSKILALRLSVLGKNRKKQDLVKGVKKKKKDRWQKRKEK